MFFTTLDLQNAFHQVAFASTRDAELAAFVTESGHYQFTCMPFGLMISPIVFQRLIDTVTQPLRRFTVAYMDELLIHSPSFDEHCTHIAAVLSALTRAELYVKPSKCKIAQRSVKFLGFIVSDSGLMADPKMVRSITDFPTPNDPSLSLSKRVARCLQFVGLSGFYRRFAAKLSSVEAPLRKLTLKDTP
jgi:hypothetical protein